MNANFTDHGYLGMYITIPVMHFALLILSIERLSKQINSTATWTRIFTKSYVIQVILVFTWIIFIAGSVTVVLIKSQTFKFIGNAVKNIAPSAIRNFVDKVTSTSYQCSIDGRLSPVFKILFIILFIILIVLIIKSMIIAIFYHFATLSCLRKKTASNKHDDQHMTLLFIIFLLLNLCLSFPFYFVSMAYTVKQLISENDRYGTSLKICFLLRITSVLLQCLIFSTFDDKSWSLLSRLLYHGTCKRFSPLKHQSVRRTVPKNSVKYVTKKRSDKTKDRYGGSKTYEGDSDSVDENRKKDLDVDTIEDETSVDVLIKKSKNRPKECKKAQTIVSDPIDKGKKSRKLTSRENDTSLEVSQKQDQMIGKKSSIRKSRSVHNDRLREVPIPELASERILSTTTNLRTSRLTTSPNETLRQSVRHSYALSSSDEHSNDKTKSYVSMREKRPLARSSSNEPKRSNSVKQNKYHSKHRRRLTKQPQSSSLTSDMSMNDYQTKSAKKSSTNMKNQIGKLNQDRLSRIADVSTKV